MLASGIRLGRIGSRLLWLGLLGAGLLLGAAGHAEDQPDEKEMAERRRYMMPSVTLAEYTEAGRDSIRLWSAEYRSKVGDRDALYEGVRELFDQHARFKDRVHNTYPSNQLEWMLITDGVADTLVEDLYPILEAYQEAHPKEELGPGRQAMELEILNGVTNPPSRMLGFLVTTMANFAYTRADSIMAAGAIDDAAGVRDGVLRNIRDWSSEYMQVHSDPISTYESRIVQEDWIIARLEDRCGNSGGGTWQLGQQYMAVVDRDTTVTPILEKFAHEIHLKAVKCEGDDRVIWIDLPNFRDVQMEIYRKSVETQQEREAEGR